MVETEAPQSSVEHTQRSQDGRKEGTDRGKRSHRGRGRRGGHNMGRGGNRSVQSTTDGSQSENGLHFSGTSYDRNNTANGNEQQESLHNNARTRSRPKKSSHLPKGQNPPDNQGESSSSPAVAQRGKRQNKFATKLTAKSESAHGQNGVNAVSKASHAPSDFSDLRSRLVAELSTGAYDCSICYACVSTKDSVWSCSQCYTVLHLNCIRTWAKASVAKVEEQNAMQEDATIRSRRGSWRCPGCQYAREEVPQKYYCWDGRVQNPSNVKGAPPHSCGKSCARKGCIHGCAAGICHPGPCPPCPITIVKACFCGAQQVSLRCSQMNASASRGSQSSVSCGGECGKVLSCGTHTCSKVCHDGECGKCLETVQAKCYCGRQEKSMACGTGAPKQSLDPLSQEDWIGKWSCESPCGRAFDCGKHFCRRPCHAIDKQTSSCPMSSGVMQRCPCGAEPLNASREHCTDPIRTCDRVCERQLSCGHTCQSLCHLDDCPPCTVEVTSPCRCGETKKRLSCHQRQREELEGTQEILCQTVCRSQRLCGKHECGRMCCPLYFQAKNKSKRRPTYGELLEQDPAGLHLCDKTCGKRLRCGLHECVEQCHRGPCPPCLQASFEELSCHCGKSVMEPPVPCGTSITCHFPCIRPPASCGHPKLQHDCHGDDDSCPPCTYLVDKRCMCEKSVVSSVPCHRSRVSCGQVCNATLSCGYHRCQQSCHEPGQCGPCTQTCMKPRKCGHPCPEACHAPSACSQKEACQAWVTLLCSCGNIQQRVRCGSSIDNLAGTNRTVRCNDSCLLAQRNAKLADALGLSSAEQHMRSLPREYPISVLSYYGNNRRFGEELESTLKDFIHSYKHAMLLSASSPNQRQFIHGLAGVFRLQSEDIDEESRRTIAIRRTQFAQPPSPSLAEAHRQNHEVLSRLRPTALTSTRQANGLSPGSSRSSTPSVELQMNALLLHGVFGVDEQTLTDSLRRLPSISSAPTHVRWINSDDVVVIIGNTSTAKLHSLRNDIMNAGFVHDGYGRLANEVTVCLCDEHGKVLRTDRTREQALPNSHYASTLNHKPASGGWAAVAAAASAGRHP